MKSQLSHYVNKMSKVCLLAFASLLFTLPAAVQANDNVPATLAIKATDDQQQALPQGDYVLYIEVVREKGGRALLKQAFKIDNTAQKFTLNETAETGEITFTVTP